MTAAVSTAVVLPVHRTRATVEVLLRRLAAAVPGCLVVAVDDACPEGSGPLLDALARDDDTLTVVHHAVNRGQQEAIRTGLRAARSAGARTVVVLDADLQDPPEAAPLLLDRLARGDVAAVFAGRTGRYSGPGRRLTGTAHRAALAAALGLPRDAGGYVVMTAALVDDVLAMDGPPQLVAMIGRSGRATTSIPVQRGVRPVGRSTIPTRGRVRHARAAWEHVLLARRIHLPGGRP